MRLAAKIAFSILTLTALGFCVAFILEAIRQEARPAATVAEVKAGKEAPQLPEVARSVEKANWQSLLAREAGNEIAFADKVLRENERQGALMLEVALRDFSGPQLEQHFAELMARDLDDHRALGYAGRVLQEIAQRSPDLGVALLSAMTPAERAALVPSVARGWTMADPQGAFAWIESAWVAPDGGYIDRGLQNDLYGRAMDVLVGELRDYEQAAEVLAGLADPDLKAELTELVAHRIVRDGPENALDRLAELETGVFDVSVMDAVAEQWAARDGEGAAQWVLANEQEMSLAGVRSIAKHLTLGAEDEELHGFHEGLGEPGKRDSVASEVSRLKARREPVVSAQWARAIEDPSTRQRAVLDALYEIGYEDIGSSLGYIDYVYLPEDEGRAPVVFSTLKDWLAVDVEAVAGYLGSGRANLSASLSEELLSEMALLPQG
ncbi:hypothetical protein IEN85_02300 [Pelagicoccus sp. NFK12]|uniref:Uncharacterized protein n=1 Tax=Pelagicoccus enzymogenes TaxID=2773457 RepID=A0A927F5N2_9BACT|nr:hypothetical protein [Pelagicoccus enzymogenes]MBD5778324.1 hypothetical protein [Pelagicoccus enzymogenes]